MRRTYNPCHDPLFGDELLALLVSRRGEAVRVYRELGIGHCGREGYNCVHAHVRRFVRHGHVIVGSHGGTYTYLGGSGLA